MRNTTLCYIQCDGAWLMLHRVKKAHDLNQGKWIGVGGGFESGESPEECLIREVREETGLRLTEYRLRGIVTFVSDQWETEYMFLYTGQTDTKSVITCGEGVLQWVPEDRVPSLPTWQGDRIFLKLIRGEHPFFSLKLRYQGDTLAEAVLDGKTLEYEKEMDP